MNITSRLTYLAEQYPGEVAIVMPTRDITRRELDDLVWSCAGKLIDSGLIKGQRVGLVCATPLAHLILALAVARIGVAHIGLALSDSAEIIEFTARQLMLSFIVTDMSAVTIPTCPVIRISIQDPRPMERSERARICAEDIDLPFLVLQSSGTTGMPKYAELSHRDAEIRYGRYESLFTGGRSDTFWAASRLEFVVAKQRTLFNLLRGTAVCFSRSSVINESLVEYLNRKRVTLIVGTPSHLHGFLAVGERLASLRLFEVRSATVHESVRSDFRMTVNSNLYVVYGTNETDTVTMATPTHQQTLTDTVGLPAPGVEIDIVDEKGVSLPIGEVGQVAIRGSGVIKCYLNNDTASSRAFRDGYFYPGDLGCLNSDGLLTLKGRSDDLMIYDGMNIYPAEIENCLCKHPSVREAAALPILDRKFQHIPAAAVTLNYDISPSILADYCKKMLGIKRPRKIFVLKEFPKNAMGKVLKRKIGQDLSRLL